MKLISVIIPVYNTSKELFFETLDSVVKQTLEKDDFEIIIVDDCSTNQETKNYILELEKGTSFEGISLKVLRHEKNMWLAQARITGAKNARGKYLVFLDSDDLIKKDYLMKAMLLLETSPKAGWVYPVIRFFGHFDSLYLAQDFNAKDLFYYNYCGTASMYRKSAWMEVLQREKFVTEKVRFFEDWDTLVRLMQKGWYGIPLNDSEFLYRQSMNSLAVRSEKMMNATKYVNWRSNLMFFIKSGKVKSNFKKYYKEGWGRRRSAFSVTTYLDAFCAWVINRFIFKKFKMHKGFSLKYFPFKLAVYSAFSPKKFIDSYLSSEFVNTKAESLSGFVDKPVIDFPAQARPDFINGKNKTKKIIFAHPWWRFGGAENILFDWMIAVKKIEGLKVIDLASWSQDINSNLKNAFKDVADEQYTLDKVSQFPLVKLKFCWNLIEKERPDIIFISANSFVYALLPLIKKNFPEIKIVDILHNEELFDSSWYGASDEYKEFIDQRVVTSEVWKKALIEKYKEKPEKINVKTNLIDLERFDPAKFNSAEIKESLGLDPNKTTIGFIGRLDEQKNPMVFLELAELMKENKTFQFLMVGDGTYYNSIKEKTARYKDFVMTGYSKNVPYYLSVCDVLVCPSKYEGFPLIGLEAGTMNVPIIATDIIGFREQITDGKFGWLYKQEENLLDAKTIMEIILENKNNFKEVGRKGREFVEKYHNFNKDYIIYKDFISKLL